MNKKLLRNIIICVVVVAVLSVAYFFAINWEPEQDEEDNLNPAVHDVIYALQINYNSISKVEINNEKGRFVINKTGDSYFVEDYDNARLSQVKIAGLLIKLENLPSQRVISTNHSLSDFGLEIPKTKVLIMRNDGELIQLLVGNPDPTASGYYVKTNIDNNIYLVSNSDVEVFFSGIDDLRNLMITTLDFSSLTSFELYNGKKLITSVRERNAGDTLTDIAIEKHIMTYPYYEYVSLQELSVALGNITDIEAVGVEKDSIANASDYGIGKYTFKYVDAGGEHVLKLGNQDADGDVYAVYEGINTIFVLDGEWLEIAENFKPFNYLYKLTHVYKIEDTAGVSVKTNKGNFELSINRTSTDPEYFINDSQVTEELYKDVYTTILNISFTGDGHDVIPGKEIGSVTFKFNDGTEKKYTYHEADDRNYVVVKPNGVKYLILRKNFDSVYGDIAKIVK